MPGEVGLQQHFSDSEINGSHLLIHPAIEWPFEGSGLGTLMNLWRPALIFLRPFHERKIKSKKGFGDEAAHGAAKKCPKIRHFYILVL